MKSKLDFVTNSSSTSYLIHNVSYSDNLTAKSFVESIWPHIQDEMAMYGFNYTKKQLIESLEKDYDQFPLPPQEKMIATWGDNDGTIAGDVFDYVLRGNISTGLVEIFLHGYNR